MNKFLYWSPRVLGVLSVLFISLFALDVFQTGTPFLQMLIGFSIHLMPSFLLLIFLIIAWKWEMVGGIVFILVSLVPFIFLSNLFWVNAMLSAPFVLTGILFILNFYYFRKVNGF